MSGDEFRRAFGVDPAAAGHHTARVDERRGVASSTDMKIQFAGSEDYRPYGWKPQGTDTCEIIWYDSARQEAREGTFWHYKTLLRVGYQETDPAQGRMAVVLYLADVNILIEGYNLYPMMERLRAYECAQMEQFSPRRHHMASKEQLIKDGRDGNHQRDHRSRDALHQQGSTELARLVLQPHQTVKGRHVPSDESSRCGCGSDSGHGKADRFALTRPRWCRSRAAHQTGTDATDRAWPDRQEHAAPHGQ